MVIFEDYGKEKFPDSDIFLFLKCFAPFLSVFCRFLFFALKKNAPKTEDPSPAEAEKGLPFVQTLYKDWDK